MRSVLDGFTPDDVMEAIGHETPRFALFSTFTFSPSAFAVKYLHPLQQRGCERTVVLVDSLGYAQSLDDAASAVGIGTDYVLRRVPAQGSFHAKLVVIQTATRTVLGVGSGNLTVAGLVCNAEVGALSILDRADARGKLDTVARRFLSLAGLCPEEPCLEGRIALDRDTWFLTTLDAPIADQLADIPSEIPRIEVTSPFVDPNGETIRWLRRRWPDAAVRLRVDPRFNSLTPRVLTGLGEEIIVQVPNSSDGARCPEVHGKLCTWFGEEHAYVLLGSANFTRAGLLDRQNVEAVVLRRMDLRDARKLIKVPEVKWRRARSDDASSPVETTSQSAFHALVAELSNKQLSLSWKSRSPAGTLQILVGTRCIASRTIDGVTTGSGTIEARVNLTNEEIRVLNMPCIARLIDSHGGEHRGWIEIKEQLETPPDAKRRLRLLEEMQDDPEGCSEDELVRFLEWLRQGLHSAQLSPTRALNRLAVPPGLDVDQDVSVDRATLLQDEPPSFVARNSGFAQLVERSFDAAAATITFFDVEQAGPLRASGKPDSRSAPSPANTRDRIPPSVERVLSALFEQMAEVLEQGPTVDVIASQLRQFPMCVKSLKYCSKRWRVGAAESRHLVSLVVVACLAPGLDSMLKQQGVLGSLSPSKKRELMHFHGTSRAIRYLACCLFALHASGALSRQDLVKDMAVTMDDLLPSEEQGATPSIWEEVWDVLGGGAIRPGYDEITGSLSHVQGEIGLVRQRRESLIAAVGALKVGKLSSEGLAAMTRQATSSDESARYLLTLLSRFSAMPGRMRLEEVERDDAACPVCFMAIAEGELAKMSDATFVHLHSCGTLLVRAIDS